MEPLHFRRIVPITGRLWPIIRFVCSIRDPQRVQTRVSWPLIGPGVDAWVFLAARLAIQFSFIRHIHLRFPISKKEYDASPSLPRRVFSAKSIEDRVCLAQFAVFCFCFKDLHRRHTDCSLSSEADISWRVIFPHSLQNILTSLRHAYLLTHKYRQVHAFNPIRPSAGQKIEYIRLSHWG